MHPSVFLGNLSARYAGVRGVEREHELRERHAAAVVPVDERRHAVRELRRRDAGAPRERVEPELLQLSLRVGAAVGLVVDGDSKKIAQVLYVVLRSFGCV